MRPRIVVTLLLALVAGLAVAAMFRPTRDVRPLGLFTTLPILWAESDDVAGMLRADTPPHWARMVLQGQGRLAPLDTLLRLPPDMGVLVLAQPRPLSPQENVALDEWLRGGGKVLLFADPMLTWHSRFALGDRRRPQDVVLLSPILTRWGLQLRFDEAQPAGERQAAAFGQPYPVNLPGRFVVAKEAKGCDSAPDGLAVSCVIGRGRLVAVADAAALEPAESAAVEAQRKAALEHLFAVLEGEG